MRTHRSAPTALQPTAGASGLAVPLAISSSTGSVEARRCASRGGMFGNGRAFVYRGRGAGGAPQDRSRIALSQRGLLCTRNDADAVPVAIVSLFDDLPAAGATPTTPTTTTTPTTPTTLTTDCHMFLACRQLPLALLEMKSGPLKSIEAHTVGGGCHTVWYAPWTPVNQRGAGSRTAAAVAC